jgi:DNA-binding beta-propeller fold protein YncE
MSTISRLLAGFAFLALFSSSAHSADFTAKREVGGLGVELRVQPLAFGTALEEDAPVNVTVRIDDGQGKPMPGLAPAAWMSLRTAGDRRPDAERCPAKVATFTVGNVFVRPEVDLNVFHVLAVNDDATITVIDPHFGFGGSRLLALVALPARGEDWTLNADSSLLFVSMPEAGSVAVIDTSNWKIRDEVEVGAKPTRVKLAPDSRYVWVADEKGASALHTDGSGIAGRIDTPSAPREILLSDDGRTIAFAGGTTVTLADSATIRKRGSVTVSSAITGGDFSHRSKQFYIATDDGHVSVIDAKQQRVVSRFETGAAPIQVRFEPRGRYGFVVVPSKNEVHIFDAVTNKIVQTADVEPDPDRVSFSDQLAYVRSLGSDMVLMIPLDQIGTEGAPVPIVDFPSGQKRFGQGPAPSIADGIVPAPGEPAVLVANPADQEIYYYREGMAAPMGHFSNDSRAPRGVLVLDRSLRRQRTGEFRTTARLSRAGTYDVAVFVDNPRIVTCFTMEVGKNAALEAKRQRVTRVEYAQGAVNGKAGEPVRIAFRLIDSATSQAKGGLNDVTALLFAPGLVNVRQTAVAQADGTYQVEVVPPSAGVYYVYIDSPTAGLPPSNQDVLIVRARG